MPLFLSCVLFSLLVLGQETKQGPMRTELSQVEQQVIRQLLRESNGTMQVTWNSETRTPALFTGTLSAPSSHSVEWITSRFLQKTKRLYGLSDVNKSFRLKQIERLPGGAKRVQLERMLFSIPVWGEHLTFDISAEGVLTRVTGRITPNLEKKLYGYPMHPTFSAGEAMTLAMSMQQAGALSASPSTAHVSCTLTYVTIDHLPVLAYVLSFTHPTGQQENVFIHAVTKRRIANESPSRVVGGAFFIVMRSAVSTRLLV